jgi:hypothetical protein
MPPSVIEIDWDADIFGGAACGTSLRLHFSSLLMQFLHDGRVSSHYRYWDTNPHKELSVLTYLNFPFPATCTSPARLFVWAALTNGIAA